MCLIFYLTVHVLSSQGKHLYHEATGEEIQKDAVRSNSLLLLFFFFSVSAFVTHQFDTSLNLLMDFFDAVFMTQVSKFQSNHPSSLQHHPAFLLSDVSGACGF